MRFRTKKLRRHVMSLCVRYNPKSELFPFSPRFVQDFYVCRMKNLQSNGHLMTFKVPLIYFVSLRFSERFSYTESKRAITLDALVFCIYYFFVVCSCSYIVTNTPIAILRWWPLNSLVKNNLNYALK